VYLFWNDIDNFQWDINDFNSFENTFAVGPEMASCNKVYIEVGHRTHEGRVLLVDDIQMSQRTTSPPTQNPTFSPTKSKNSGPTSQPTVKTDAPTTTNSLSCPPVGSPPINVPPGSVMLGYGDTLCTLTKNIISSTSGSATSIPVALSYHGNPWEQSAGEFATSFFANEDILCYSNGCQINLPPLGVQESYLLTTLDYSLAENEEYARFLETATFGITEEQLDAFKNSPASVHDDIVTWISDQMNSTTTPLTSHREFLRRGVIGRLPTSTSEATGDHPCDLYSRWRKMSFVRHERESFLRVIGEGPFRLEMDGWLRTIVTNFTVEEEGYSTYSFNSNFEYELCRSPEEEIGGNLYLRLEDENCVEIVHGNPLVNLDGFESSVNHIVDLPDNSLQPIDRWWTKGGDLIYRMDISLFNNPAFLETCSSLPSVPQNSDGPVFGRLSDGTWLMFDPRINLETNTMVEPISDGGKQTSINSNGETYCSNVPRTFLNENECKLSMDACKASSESSQVEILLDNSTIAMLNNLTGRYTYAIQGLLVNYDGIILEHPCTPGLRSRWERKNPIGCDATELYDATNETLSHLLSDSGDDNPFMRDIYFPEEGTYCNSSDTEPEIEIEVDGECWTRVHPEHMSIFDMTYWVDNHPGGPYAIQKWSENNGAILVYPSTLEGKVHGMSRWNNNWHKFTYIGRFGDHLSLSDLPTNLRGLDVMNYFGSTQGSDSSKVLVCGSPGEVANDKSGGFRFDLDTGFSTVDSRSSQRKFVWTMIALDSLDQLRQRVSWAMSQILVVVEQAISTQSDRTEQFLAYYDIFVRNAFGNYRDVLREISYNALMAENLSFLGSKSSAYVLERYRVKTSADENFAREIMQLFTMGLVQLNMDGSPKLDEIGNTILAYTNDDIMSFSRAWTGFDLQLQRGNMEGRSNRLDPMRINAEWRDRFPKTDTTGGYIGDKYLLCNDLPPKAFLKTGAQYRLLGSSSLPELMSDPTDFSTESEVVRVVLDNSSTLRSQLCNENLAGNCDFKNTVVLQSNAVCAGIECYVDTVRVVQVESDVFYEFVPPPCVTFSFYNNPVKISPRKSSYPAMCADPTLAVASEACCSIGSNDAQRDSRYSGERMIFTTAETRCSTMSQLMCDSISEVEGPSFLNSGYFWTADSCLLQVKIKRDGTLTIVHKPGSFSERVGHVDVRNENYFKVYWERGGDYPTVDNDCDGVCQILSEGTCLCNTGVLENTVFRSMPSSKAEIIEKLNIGASDPNVLDSDMYTSVLGTNDDFIVHLKDNAFSADTIFEYEDEKGRTFFVKNIHSSVHLRAISGGYTGQSFRNAPQFMSFIPTETNVRDAQYETEAVLDHYFFHDNTPPFLALRLIQRLVMSNPAPRYIQVVAEAFKSGFYLSGDSSFGTGRYGDLSATFAAIYLDRAARNVVLDKDVASGAMREPILKIMSLMRSMDLVPLAPIIVTNNIVENIGQMAHEFQTVFSFFLPEHKPYGRVGDAALVSPEATLLDMPKIIGILNGMNSMIKFGLSRCNGGLFQAELSWSCRQKKYLPSPDGILEFNKTYVDSETEFSFETFEGPSLRGGFDNTWIGRYFNFNYGRATVDPTDSSNHVLHFTTTSSNAYFFSEPIQNLDTNGNPIVVKFRYFGQGTKNGGCIGYVNGTVEPNTQDWEFCDDYNMESDGTWISCQFVIPAEVASFRIAVGDKRSPAKDAYFDDIQIGTGDATTCSGVDVPKNVPPGQEGYSNTVVDKLSTLLTAGRLGSKSKSIIVDAYDSAGSADDGLILAQQLIVTTSEFHTTNTAESTDQPRDEPTLPQSTGKPYRAVVNLFLAGGLDSFNMLVPHTCSNDLYGSYLDVRQQVALPKDRLLRISAADQVCSSFGLHPEFSAMKTLYNDGDLLFFANTGAMSQPVTKQNYNQLTNMQLFAHNHMQRETRRVDPYDISSGTGVLGRMTDVLTKHGHNTDSFSVGGHSVTLSGIPGVSDTQMIVSSSGFPEIYLDDGVTNDLPKLHNNTKAGSSIFADSWSASLMESIGINELLRNELNSVTTTYEFPDSSLGRSLETIAKLIATREVRGSDVDTFYVSKGGFDTHSDVEENLNNLLGDVNDALAAFANEMKSLNVWNNVTLIQTSDFARTLNPNGGDGTDHAWGGNYIMMGGSVQGGQVLGKYPEDITDDGQFTLGRGRMVPTTPWEAPFCGIASWLGIGANDMDEVCPNLFRFNSSYIISPEVMFTEIIPPSTRAPITFTPAPTAAPVVVVSTPAPVASTPAPVASTPAPVASTPAPVASTPAPVASTPAPVASTPAPVVCADKREAWTIGDISRSWCTWAAKTSTASRCKNRDLYADCPVTCGRCILTPAPVQTTPTPTVSTPAPTVCVDREESWKIGSRTRNWCAWARKGVEPDIIASKCTQKGINSDCPVTCFECIPSTPAPVASTPAPVASTPAPTSSIEVQFVGNPCTSNSPGGECAICTGDCDKDSDCAGDLRCAQRGGNASTGNVHVPGCVWGPDSDSLRLSDDDFCFMPISQPGVINYVGECSSTSYLCGLCESDCDSDSDCEGDLICVRRDGFEAVEGCTGEGGPRDLYSDDVCAPDPASITPAPVASTPAPVVCADKREAWTIGDISRSWCTWAAKTSTASRCKNRDLYADCPVTCGRCS